MFGQASIYKLNLFSIHTISGVIMSYPLFGSCLLPLPHATLSSCVLLRLWRAQALQKLRVLDLRGCAKLDDTALNCLANCAALTTRHSRHEKQDVMAAEHASHARLVGGISHTNHATMSESNLNCSGSPDNIVFDEMQKYHRYNNWLQVGSNEPGSDINSPHAKDIRWNYNPTTSETVSILQRSTSPLAAPATRCNTRQDCNVNNATSSIDERGSNMLPSLRTLNISGCRAVSSTGLALLLESGMLRCVNEVDLSGCDLLTTTSITALLSHCPHLSPDKVAYCDNICDVPREEEMNGCANLAHPLRHCCRRAL